MRAVPRTSRAHARSLESRSELSVRCRSRTRPAILLALIDRQPATFPRDRALGRPTRARMARPGRRPADTHALAICRYRKITSAPDTTDWRVQVASMRDLLSTLTFTGAREADVDTRGGCRRGGVALQRVGGPPRGLVGHRGGSRPSPSPTTTTHGTHPDHASGPATRRGLRRGRRRR